jgi:23S rRNA (adenine2503-C2)-methyltransferase
MDKTKLIGMTLEQLRQVAAQCKLPAFSAKQIAKWLYEKRVTDIDQMTDISLRGREALKKQFCVGLCPPKAEAHSIDGTIKCLFEGKGGRDIEAVLIPDKDRATICVSSQAGCKMGCKFCMTGRQGFHGNLDAADIINQVMSIPRSCDLTNIVFMGMGEPLDNLSAVMTAIEVLTAPWGFAWSPKRITVSSIGKLPELKRLLDETKVHVAISVHLPFADERAALMPSERAFPIAKVIELLKGYDFAHQRRLTVEYIIWRGINDDFRHADALARLLHGTDCRVNLIRYHALPDSELKTASEETMVAFRDRLNAKGVTATIRTSRGEDIQAACGMLAGEAKK